MYCYKCGKFDEHNSNFCRNCAAPMFRADGKLKKINTKVQGVYKGLGKQDRNNEDLGKDYTIIMDKRAIEKGRDLAKEKNKGTNMLELINKLMENYKKEVIIALSLILTIILVFAGLKLIDNPGGAEASATSKNQNSAVNKQENSSEINNGGSDGYVLINSHKEKLSEDDVKNLDLCYLMIARNEIYARHGYVFKDTQLQKYFESKDWYSKDKSFNGSIKNSIEQHNIQLIREAENNKNKALSNTGKKLTSEEALKSLLQNTNLKLKDGLDPNKGKTYKYFGESFYKYPARYFSGQDDKVEYLVSRSTGKVYIYTENGDFYAYK